MIPRRFAAAFLVLLGVLGASGALAQPSSNLYDYALFAETSIFTKGLLVSDGDIGVNQDNGFLNSPTGGINAPNSVVASDSVRIAEVSSCMSLFANTVLRTGPSCGSQLFPPGTPFTTPIIADLETACGFPPAFPACNPVASINVFSDHSIVLPPGVYGRVHARKASSITFTGGNYTFCTLRAGRHARLLFQAPSVVNVGGVLDLGDGTYTGPDVGSGITAADIQFYHNGHSAHFSSRSDVFMRLCAPFARLRITEGASLAGNFFVNQARTEHVFFNPVCGDSIVFPGGRETCDPPGSDPPPPGGNLCRADCTYCGDAKVQRGEQCDDGNNIDDDNCHNDCTFNQPPGCGNGVIDTPGETCEPPGSDPPPPGGNLCRINCTYCGDGIANSGEQCDDGNTVDNDSCANDCTGASPALCGNQVLNPGETCDPPGSDTPPPPGGNLCRVDCTYCGDGVQNPGEQCDDGNTNNLDACANNCTSTAPTSTTTAPTSTTTITMTTTSTTSTTSSSCPACGANPSFNLGAADGFAVLGLADGSVVFGTDATHITGNVGVGPRDTGDLRKATIDGKLLLDPTNTATVAPDLVVTCGIESQDLTGADADARAASTFLAAKPPTQTFGTINTDTTITSAGGENVINVTTIDLLNQDLTLVGGPTDTFIINVTTDFSCRGTCHIDLAGGLTYLNVIFNITGAGTEVFLKDLTVTANGIFLAPLRSVTLDKATLNGAIISGGTAGLVLTVHSGAQLNYCAPCPACT